MPVAVVLAFVALGLLVVMLARTAVALDALELSVRSAVTMVRAVHRSLREAGVLAESVGRDSVAGEVTLGRLEELKARDERGTDR